MIRFTRPPIDWPARYREYLGSLVGTEGREAVNQQVRAASRFLRWCESHGIKPEEATGKQVERWIRQPRPDGRSSAETTQYTRRTYLSRFYRWWMDEPDSYCNDNPALEVKVRSPSVAKRATAMRLLEPGEAKAMLEAVEAWTASPHRARNRVVIGLLVHHGLRPAEVRSARLWDYRRGRSGVSATLQTSIRRAAGKEPFDLEPGVASAIDHYVRMWRSGPVRGPGAWLLLSGSGGPLYEHAVMRLVHAVAERAGLERPWEVSPYTLRRTLLNDALREGMSVAEISALAGHRSVLTTEQYLARFVSRPSPERVWAWREAQLRVAS